jgi:hypothetical protein
MNKVHYHFLFTLSGLFSNSLAPDATTVEIKDKTHQHIKLVLETGLYEPDYAKNLFGPPELILSDDMRKYLFLKDYFRKWTQ